MVLIQKTWYNNKRMMPKISGTYGKKEFKDARTRRGNFKFYER